MQNFCRRLLPGALAFAIIPISGCATATRGYRQYWVAESTPLGATVSLSNGVRCETPCRKKLPRKYAIAVEICKPGFRAASAEIVSRYSRGGGALMAGNVVAGGVVGAGLDAVLGSSKDLRPNPLVVQLVAEAPGCVTPSFPAVPEGGQTPAAFQAAENRRKPVEPLRYTRHSRTKRTNKPKSR